MQLQVGNKDDVSIRVRTQALADAKKELSEMDEKEILIIKNICHQVLQSSRLNSEAYPAGPKQHAEIVRRVLNERSDFSSIDIRRAYLVDRICFLKWKIYQQTQGEIGRASCRERV